MVYQVPKSKASIGQNRFRFEIDGTEYEIPLLKYITGDVVREMAELEAAGGMRRAWANYIMFGPADSPVGRAVRTLDQEQLADLAGAWAEESGVTPGESLASRRSSKGSTGRPSNTTS